MHRVITWGLATNLVRAKLTSTKYAVPSEILENTFPYCVISLANFRLKSAAQQLIIYKGCFRLIYVGNPIGTQLEQLQGRKTPQMEILFEVTTRICLAHCLKFVERGKKNELTH